MAKSITILDPEYRKWVQELKARYRRSQIKAATKVNQEMIQYYWDLGRDIVEMHVEDRWGEKVIRTLAADLKREMPDASGLSRSNLYYTKRFYLLYSKEIEKLKESALETAPQSDEIVQQAAGQIQGIPDTQIVQQAVGQFMNAIYSVPWGHHIHLIDKFEDMPEKAMFYIRKSIEESWSRNVMDHFIASDLYAREGQALTNFSRTLPPVTGDLAQELTKYKLGDVAEVLISNVDKKSKLGESKVSLCNFTDVYYNWAVTRSMVPQFMKATAPDAQIKKFTIHKGQVAITKDSETRHDIGIPCYMADDLENTVLGYHCALISPNPELLDGQYLNAYLNSRMAKEYFANNATGSGMRYTLSIDTINDIQLYIPSIQEQKRIGHLFADIDRKIALNCEINRNLPLTA